MASVNQTQPYCVNEMGKTHSKPLAARHGREMAWARHTMCESALSVLNYHLGGTLPEGNSCVIQQGSVSIYGTLGVPREDVRSEWP
jgi:hypothetical protein